jgi:hypothetical protein
MKVLAIVKLTDGEIYCAFCEKRIATGWRFLLIQRGEDHIIDVSHRLDQCVRTRQMIGR